MCLQSAKSNLSKRGCQITSSGSDHGRTMVGSCSNRPPLWMTLHPFSALVFSFFGMSYVVAGAILGDVGGWGLLLGAMWMTFDVWRGSIMSLFVAGKKIWWRCCSTQCTGRFIYARRINDESHGTRNIWWRWTVRPVALRNVYDVSIVMGINHEIHFSWQGQYLVTLDGEVCWSAQYHSVWRWTVRLVAPRNIIQCVCCCGRRRACPESIDANDFVRWSYILPPASIARCAVTCRVQNRNAKGEVRSCCLLWAVWYEVDCDAACKFLTHVWPLRHA